ncbi:MAG: hypothetical protein JNJ96_07925 [Anaerolineales bacterium]|jgi:hypothetical protein|nr:hypothetical protein [Anaerolineales bacterium]HNQ95467.1 hypothetical protein [Anaerolineales bacterium]
MNLDGFTIVLGVLGAYFAILLVLSVSVETLLEPFTWFRGLRKQASPDDVLASVQEWLPEGSEEAKKVVAIQTFVSQTKTNMVEIDKTVKALRDDAVKALEDMGLEEQVNSVQKDIALKLATLRQKHASTEKSRITTLRVVSALIGIAIAFIMQINTFQLLGVLFPEDVIASLNTPIGHIGGILATGLAASAGSSFWHDMLGRVRNLKNLSEQAGKAIGELGSGGGGGGGGGAVG